VFQHIISPIDGSDQSVHAVEIGARIAAECDADLEMVCVAPTTADEDDAREVLARVADAHEDLPVAPQLTTLVGDPVASTIAQHAESISGSMIVLSSTGRGRTAAVLGSVAEDLVREMFGPIIVVGPSVGSYRPLSNDLIVPVDGSHFSETSLPLAGAWSVALGAEPWVIEVLSDGPGTTADVHESAYAAREARSLQSQTHHPVEFEVLHGHAPATAIVDFATRQDAGLIVMSTHGRTGLQRLTTGSVAAGVIHRAPCPVVLHRPPKFADESS
jgi:nucleotide-binding universal stress UspA family protein